MTLRVPHLTEPLGPARMPARHVVFDTEARSITRFGATEQTWSLGAYAAVSRSRAGEWSTEPPTAVRTPQELWEGIIRTVRAKSRTIVWCHNLAYDLRISDGLRVLPGLGFSLDGVVLERTASWASFRSEQGGLLVCDLYSFIPAPLSRIALDLGIDPIAVDFKAASDEQLQARCNRDVEITAAAVRQLVTYLETECLGPFRPTGSGQSAAAWRCRFHRVPVLIHDDPEALDCERRAMWTGRCEAWRWGPFDELPVTEYDLHLAYCHIAHECDVPTRLYGRSGPMNYEAFDKARGRYRILADCTVTTRRPVVPAAYGDRIHWPVGTFNTLLWDPELALAWETGATVKVHRVWLYTRAPVLRDFAGWTIEQLAADDRTTPPMIRRLLKHWSRTLVGRMALRYRRWEDWAGGAPDDLVLETFFDLTTDTESEMLQVGAKIMMLAELAEADSSAPQVTGWVMSEARRRLWQLTILAGHENVLYLDTDSLLVTPAGARRLNGAIARGEAYSLVRKQTATGLEIHAPRNLTVGGQRRLSGIPLSARRTGPLEYDGEVWRGVKESMTRGELSSVAVMRRSFKVHTQDPRRHHLPGGNTHPHEEAPYED